MNSVLEQADNRIVCHIGDIISKGYSEIMVHTVDSDVIVILLGFMSEFMVANASVEITVDFKTRSRCKYISITLFILTLKVTSVLVCHSFTPSPEQILLAHFSNNQKRIGLGEMLRYPNERIVE